MDRTALWEYIHSSNYASQHSSCGAPCFIKHPHPIHTACWVADCGQDPQNHFYWTTHYCWDWETHLVCGTTHCHPTTQNTGTGDANPRTRTLSDHDPCKHAHSLLSPG